MGRAEDLFQRLVRNGEAEIEEFFNNRQSEELFLDFKRSGDEGKGRNLHPSDLNNLAKAISGFGNSEGGVIVWGVDCNDKSKTNTGDLPQSRVYVEDPYRFASRLEGAVSGRTVPPHPSVRHHPIMAATGNNEGYVATYIPKSYLAPHQAIGEDRYYIRAGSNFLPIIHSVLAGMFGQHPQPTIALTIAVLQSNFDRSGAEKQVSVPFIAGPASRMIQTYTVPLDIVNVTLALGLEGHGPGLTKDLYMTISPSFSLKNARMSVTSSKKAHEKQNDWTMERGFNDVTSFVSTSQYRLAPAFSVYPVHLECSFSPPFTSDLSYSITFGFQGSPVQIVHVRVDRDVIVENWELLVDRSLEVSHFIHTALGLEQLGISYKQAVI